jgi:hypothetical protein
MVQNVTLCVEKELLQKVKVLAAQRGTSISSLLTRYLQQILQEEEAYQIAARKALALLDQGFSLGGALPASREEWHER